MIITKPLELNLNKYGEYLGVKGQCFEVRDKKGSREIPFHKVKRAVISSGNIVSTSALFWLATYGIDTVFTSKTGKVISLMIPYEADSRADIRVKQYQAYLSPRGVEIANQIVENRLRTQRELLINNDMNSNFIERYLAKLPVNGERIDSVRYDFLGIEGHASQYYFREYLKQFPDWLKPKRRTTHKAPEPLNNMLNLGHELLKREVTLAVVTTHLDPFLGYMHSPQLAKPSLVYDMMERFRYIVEQFVLDYQDQVSESSFELRGKRVFMREEEEIRFLKKLNKRLDRRIEYVRRNNSKTTMVRTAIKEEASLLAKYLLNDEKSMNYIKINKME